MKTENEQIDALIKEALSKEEAEYYDKLDEQNVLQQFTGLYKGKNSWMNYLVTIFIFISLGVGIYAGFQFAGAEETKDLLIWSLAMIGCFVMIAMLKIWSWMQMDKTELVREIKRMELQVSALANKK